MSATSLKQPTKQALRPAPSGRELYFTDAHETSRWPFAVRIESLLLVSRGK